MIDIVPLADFPVRPPLRDGESLGSWCWRIYLANGHDVPKKVRSAAKTIRADQEIDTNYFLVSIFGPHRLMALLQREHRLTERWNSQFPPNWYVWSTTPRFCPLCVAETGCHMLSWDLPLVSACGLHGCLLSEKCHSCARRWSWMTMRQGWQCDCGATVAKEPVQQAPLFSVRFSRVLAAASDAQVPSKVKEVSSVMVPDCSSYCTRDVYEVLSWLLRMRRMLTEKYQYPLPRSWPMVQRKGARMVPGAWEFSVMAGLPSTMDLKARYALHWFFRDSRTTLVDLNQVTYWRDVKGLIEALDVQRNPLSKLIHNAIDKVLKAGSAGVPGRNLTLFNPRLNMVQRRNRILELSVWWRSLSACISILDAYDRLDQRSIRYGQIYSGYESYSSSALALMNDFFEAAHRGSPTQAFGPLARRWQIPEELRRPNDLLAQLCGYLHTLHNGELQFVLALADTALNRPDDQELELPRDA